MCVPVSAREASSLPIFNWPLPSLSCLFLLPSITWHLTGVTSTHTSTCFLYMCHTCKHVCRKYGTTTYESTVCAHLCALFASHTFRKWHSPIWRLKKQAQMEPSEHWWLKIVYSCHSLKLMYVWTAILPISEKWKLCDTYPDINWFWASSIYRTVKYVLPTVLVRVHILQLSYMQIYGASMYHVGTTTRTLTSCDVRILLLKIAH